MTQKNAALTLGFRPNASTWTKLTTDGAISTTLTALGLSFVPSATKTLSAFRVYMTAITGTPSITFGVHPDSSGLPGTETDAVTVNSGWPAAGNWVDVDLSSLAIEVTGGSRYWIVIKATTTGASATFNWGNSGTGPDAIHSVFSTTTNSGLWGWSKAGSADGGTTWTNYAQNISGYRISYSDSSYDGFPAASIAVPSAADRVYGTRQRGVLITSPSNVIPNVIGVAMPVLKSGSGPDSLQYRVVGGSVDSTTAAIPKANVGTGNSYWYPAYFSEAITLAAATDYRILLDNSGTGGDSSNAFGCPEYVMDGTSDLYPWAAQSTVSADGSSFTDTANQFCPFVLILDSAGEFTAASTSGGLRTHPGMTGGCNG